MKFFYLGPLAFWVRRRDTEYFMLEVGFESGRVKRKWELIFSMNFNRFD